MEQALHNCYFFFFFFLLPFFFPLPFFFFFPLPFSFFSSSAGGSSNTSVSLLYISHRAHSFNSCKDKKEVESVMLGSNEEGGRREKARRGKRK